MLTVLFWYFIAGIVSLAFSGVMFYNITSHPRLAAGTTLFRVILLIVFVIFNFIWPIVYSALFIRKYNELGLEGTITSINLTMLETARRRK